MAQERSSSRKRFYSYSYIDIDSYGYEYTDIGTDIEDIDTHMDRLDLTYSERVVNSFSTGGDYVNVDVNTVDHTSICRI